MSAPDQSALNDAAAHVKAELGLADIANSAWTLEQRKNYLDAFRALVLANQEQFAPQTVSIANAINTSTFVYDHSADADLAVANAYLDATAAAGLTAQSASGLIDAFNGVGQGLANLGAILPLVIPIGLILVVIFAAKSGAKKAESAVTF